MNERQKVTIIINGKEYEVEMWHNEVEKVIAAAEHEPFTGYEKMEEGDYYYIDQCNDISDNPNIVFDASDICYAWQVGAYILFYDKTQKILNCDAMLE